jgi:hypothetical protein
MNCTLMALCTCPDSSCRFSATANSSCNFPHLTWRGSLAPRAPAAPAAQTPPSSWAVASSQPEPQPLALSPFLLGTRIWVIRTPRLAGSQ